MPPPLPHPVHLLSGVRVCLSAHYVPGPLAAFLLQGLGAEIIKVEPPAEDMLRGFPPFFGSGDEKMGAWFRSLNGGFKSIVLNLKQPQGVEVFRQLLGQCDILIDGNRPGQIEKLLQSPLNAAFPHLIYVPISAHGQSGPLRNTAAHDGNLLAMAGNLSYTASGPEGMPAMFSAPIVDILSAHTAALCAVAGLAGRDRGHAGPRSFDVSLLHNAFFLNQLQVAAMNLMPEPPRHDQAWMNGGLANYKLYACADGKPVFFGPIEPHLFAAFCHAAQRPELIPLLYADNSKLVRELRALFAAHTRDEWNTLLEGTDCCFSPVHDLAEALQDPQIVALGLRQKVTDPNLGEMQLAAFPAGFGPDSAPPLLPASAPKAGAHTREVLAQVLGFSEAVVAGWMEAGIVAGE